MLLPENDENFANFDFSMSHKRKAPPVKLFNEASSAIAVVNSSTTEHSPENMLCVDASNPHAEAGRRFSSSTTASEYLALTKSNGMNGDHESSPVPNGTSTNNHSTNPPSKKQRLLQAHQQVCERSLI